MAKRRIATGEELTIEYVDPEEPVAARRRRTREDYGFVCGCPKCEAEASGGAEAGAEREHEKGAKDAADGGEESAAEDDEGEDLSRVVRRVWREKFPDGLHAAGREERAERGDGEPEPEPEGFLESLVPLPGG